MTKNSEGLVIVPLTRAQADFLLENCRANMLQGLALLSKSGELELSENSMVKVVAMIESFKSIKETIEGAVKGD